MDGDDLYHNAAYVVTSVGQCAQYVQLTSMERQSVLDVWDNMLRYHDEGHDVTSPGGGMR
jgi:coenzyme F420-reducing hydrogenase gamma subunit